MNEKANRVFDDRELIGMISPVKQILKNLFNIIINIAPEREAEFLSLFKELYLKVTDQPVGRAYCFPSSSYIEISRGLAEFCWSSAYSYLVLYDYIIPFVSDNPSTLNLQEEEQMEKAVALINWGIGCISEDILQPWPTDLPQPKEVIDGIPLEEPYNSAMVLSATALAFIVFHELGHISLGHTKTSGESNIIQEKEADRFAFDWLLEDASESQFKQRSLGIAICLITFLGVEVHRPGNRSTHPYWFERFSAFADEYFFDEPDGHVWAMAVIFLELHLEAKGIPVTQEINSTMKDLANEYLDLLSRNIC